MRSVTLSAKSARFVLDFIESKPVLIEGLPASLRQHFTDLTAALRASLAQKPKTSARKKTERKRRTKKEETAAIREAVFARAGGRCEACSLPFGDLDPGELDHFFGRGKEPQSVENCWALCHTCHRLKTDNRPDAAHWIEVFLALVAEAYGYREATTKARNRLAFVNARGGR